MCKDGDEWGATQVNIDDELLSRILIDNMIIVDIKDINLYDIPVNSVQDITTLRVILNSRSGQNTFVIKLPNYDVNGYGTHSVIRNIRFKVSPIVLDPSAINIVPLRGFCIPVTKEQLNKINDKVSLWEI